MPSREWGHLFHGLYPSVAREQTTTFPVIGGVDSSRPQQRCLEQRTKPNEQDVVGQRVTLSWNIRTPRSRTASSDTRTSCYEP
jgi:hypothetical protein